MEQLVYYKERQEIILQGISYISDVRITGSIEHIPSDNINPPEVNFYFIESTLQNVYCLGEDSDIKINDEKIIHNLLQRLDEEELLSSTIS